MIALSSFIVGFNLLVLLWVRHSYNSITKKQHRIQYAEGTVQTMLEKRYDLIPKLTQIVGKFVEHEQKMLSEMLTHRNALVAGQVHGKEATQLQTTLTNELGQVMIMVDGYPELKADRQFLKLQAAHNEVEEQVAAAKRTFDAAVMSYNNAVVGFPSNLVAKLFGFEPIYFSNVPDSEQEAEPYNELHQLDES